MICRVAGEVGALSAHRECESAPERLVAIVQPTTAEVSGGSRRDVKAVEFYHGAEFIYQLVRDLAGTASRM